MALGIQSVRAAGWPHHLPHRFVPFRNKPPARLAPPVPAAEADALPVQLEQVTSLAQSLTDSAAAVGVPPTTLLAAAAVVGVHERSPHLCSFPRPHADLVQKAAWVQTSSYCRSGMSTVHSSVVSHYTVRWHELCVPAAVLGGGALLWQASRGGMDGAAGAAEPSSGGTAAQARKPQDAVLVFGATGKLGRLVVQKVSAITAPWQEAVQAHRLPRSRLKRCRLQAGVPKFDQQWMTSNVPLNACVKC